MSAAATGHRPRITARTVQVALGIIWLADGLLQLQPMMFGTGFADNIILPSAQGQPWLVSSVITHMAHLIAAQPALTDIVFAGVQILIGAGLLLRETVKAALVVSCVWALGVWILGEGLGGLLTGSASPLTGAPGAALLYVAIGLLVWPRHHAGTVDGPAAAEGPIGSHGGRAVWAVLWCGMAALWILPANRAPGSVKGAITGAASGEPGWLSHLDLSVAHSLGTGTSLAVIAAVLSLVIGLGPLVTRHTTPFLVVGVALALDFWVFGQAFGQLLTGMATDPSMGPLVVLLALALYDPRPVAVRAAGPVRVERQDRWSLGGGSVRPTPS